MNRIYVVIGVVILASCGVSHSNKEKENSMEYSDAYVVDDTEQPLDEMDSEEEGPSAIPVYQATETVYTDLIHTKLEVRFDWNKAWMYGKETLTAKPHFYASDSLFLDAKGMEIQKISLGNQTLDYKYDGNNLRIKLDKIYTKNEKYTLMIEYIAKPNERKTSGSEAITSDKGLYFINPTGEDPTKMPHIWTQGETEASSVWFPTIDAPNVKTTEEIYITVDPKYVTLSNGKLVSATKNSDGTRTDYWKQELAHAPYLFMMAVGEFKVVKDSYTRANGSKMEVNYYVEPAWESSAKAIFGETPKMIEFFSQLTGVEYPWDKYSQIIVREYVSGAMENTGAVVFGDFTYKTPRELIDDNDNSTIAHELFHHWFGDLVTAESWSNLTLNESFANYSQYLWDEHRYGIDEADFNAEKEADGYFQSVESGSIHDLVWFDYENREQMFDAHSYNKGGRILHMLRNYIGDEAFFQGIKKYLTENKFKAAEFHQLRLAFEEVSGQDLNWFFNQWYLDEGHPTISIIQSLNGDSHEVELYVNQSGTNPTSLFKIPVQIAVYDDAGMHIHSVVMDERNEIFKFPVQGTLKSVVFDYQHMLLANIVEEKPNEQFIQQFYLGKRYADRRDALLYGIPEENLSLEAQQLILDALKDPFWGIRNMAIERAKLLEGEYKALATQKIKELALSDSKSAVRATAVGYLEGGLSAKELETVMLQIIHSDQSYMVLGNALGTLSQFNPSTAMAEAKKLENEPSSKMKSGIAQLYAMQGKETEFAFFEKLMMGNDLNGIDALYALNSMTLYMSRQAPALQVNVLKFYKNQAKNGSLYVNMFLPQNVEYMLKMVQDQIEKTKADLITYEKNNQPVNADQARANLNIQQTLSSELQVYLSTLNTEKK